MTTTRIPHLRQEQGWTQERLATESGVGVRTIQRLEAGEETSLETLSLVADALRVSVREMVASPERSTSDLSERAHDFDLVRAEQQSARNHVEGAWVWLYIGLGVVVTAIALLTGASIWLGVTLAYWTGGFIILRALTTLLLEPRLDRRFPLSRSRRERRGRRATRPQASSAEQCAQLRAST